MNYCGRTFSGPKLYLCVPEIFVLGHMCTPEGQLPDESRIFAIRKWGPCQSLSEVHTFLGTVGVVWILISVCSSSHKVNLKGQTLHLQSRANPSTGRSQNRPSKIHSPLCHWLHLICLHYTSHRHVLHSHQLSTMPMQCHHAILTLIQSILLHYAQR
jgi:hypothetical protein